jgi:hypothetical protein
MAGGALSVVILSDKAGAAGKRRDAEVLEAFSRQVNNMLKHRVGLFKIVDPREHPVPSDVQIHLEFPVLENLCWSRVNILVVNPAKYTCDYYEAIQHHFDFLVFYNEAVLKRFTDAIPAIATKAICLPVATKFERGKVGKPATKEIAMFVGGSAAKEAAAKTVISMWKAEYPPLSVYALRDFMKPEKEDGTGAGAAKKASMRNVLEVADALAIADMYGIQEKPEWVTMKIGNFSDAERIAVMQRVRGIIVVAEKDDAAHTMVEALEIGNIVIANDIDAYVDIAARERYKEAVISMEVPLISVNMDKMADFTALAERELDRVIDKFTAVYNGPIKLLKNGTTDVVTAPYSKLWTSVGDLIDARPTRKFIPPVVKVEDCPNISVVTLLYNRRKFFNVAAHNMLLTDYPHDKIEWILVDDSDNVDENASDLIVKFQNSHPEFRNISYVPLTEKKSIGVKRNLGVEIATADIVLMMDDDDHYPQTSFRRRVSWLLSTWPDGAAPKCVGCTSIAMYDLMRGVSAVNVPPHELKPASRISEATLTFYKSFWMDRKFPDVSVSEGERWLAGSEKHLMPIPPQQIIVAFNHGKNASARKIPDRADKGCFWGFPREYLEFIHDAAGLNVEWSDKKK